MTQVSNPNGRVQPLLLKFAKQSTRKTLAMRYDAGRKVNLLRSGVPAVVGGGDLKTVPPGTGED